MDFNQKDVVAFTARGITPEKVNQQLEYFKKGFPFLKLSAPAALGKGITQLNAEQQAQYVAHYEAWTGSRMKFVPASGAATRMFKSLYEAKDRLSTNTPVDWSDKAMKPAKDFFYHLLDFAFYDKLKQCLHAKGIDLTQPLSDEEKKEVLSSLLDTTGMNYGGSPKGMLLFHRHTKQIRSAFEEHLVEAALYAKAPDGTAQLHFTVSPEHRAGFESLLNKVKTAYENDYGVRYQVGFSEQKKSTDTIAVDMQNQPFRETDDSILFRPAGHGALLENLNDLSTELVFIKNIDNVVAEQHLSDTIHWKKVLAGFLLEARQQVFAYLELLDKGAASRKKLEEMSGFIKHSFGIEVPGNLTDDQLKARLYHLLDRPIRICGMVKNVGEPGGGPFLANNADGMTSLQIAESSQINLDQADQKAIFAASTHFNPVDLVCSFHNHLGKKFDLLRFRDTATGFISVKTKDGKELKAQELPGLWNGAMSNWNTIFVETPLSTFNPVKTVNDLLKKEHQ